MVYEEEQKEGHSKKDQHHDGEGCKCVSCVCEVLDDLLKQQQRHGEDHCVQSLKSPKKHFDVIPFMLQTPYGHPFFTFGKVGSKHCFITVFFKVVKVDCHKNCAVLELLKPDRPIFDHETDCVEIDKICDVKELRRTGECVFVDLSCYSAVKLISPELVKTKT
ncbi:CotY/CotZ family spore coat protein [Aquisalibacillus elongatus]|uniref:Spore coat protein Z n=1 Tax=Aquisalibacillus elongatus TaxID=485577 RepID=A0A3N5AZI4_9BACI|nr:CotY/CotZ family spore coat protein [Aquisalibacillus elongatus]RPF50696.1 spore coat protein Z [Aquisalibacillus elongatus]